MKYMQEWEERELERRNAIELGQELKLKELVKKKLSRGKTLEVIAEELEEPVETIRKLAKS